MEKVTRKNLEARIEWLNKALDRPALPWLTESGRNVGQVGHFSLDHNIGGWQIEEMVNESGGVTCPFGHYRLTSGEMCRLLDGILAAIKITKENTDFVKVRKELAA